MPKRNRERSLEERSLEIVAENMKHVWARDYRDNHLAGFHVEKLIFSLWRTKRLTPPLLHSLILPQMTVLNLSFCSDLVKRDAARIIAMRCKNLSSLNLHGCKWIPATALASLVEGLPCLVKLDLSQTQCNKRVLSALASSCQRLQELNISWCNKLSLVSLPHLAYNCTQGSFCCQALEKLAIFGLGGRGDQFSALAFMLLALSNLKHLGHEFASEAVVIIHKRQFEKARLPHGFPSLAEVAQLMISTQMNEGRSTFSLPLLEIDKVGQSFLPILSAMCPFLANVNVELRNNSPLVPNFFNCRHLTHLSLSCGKDSPRDLRDLLPVTAFLGAQLQSLIIHDFSFVKEFSFHALLRHCPKLQEFEVSFFPPRPRHDRQLDAETTDWDFSLPLEFPQLSKFYVECSTKWTPLPHYHAMVLRQCVVDLMKQSPCLKSLNLTRLPFSLDQVFKEVVKAPGAALQQLCDLSLVQVKISMCTIHLLLSLENPLELLILNSCPGIDKEEYEELLTRIVREGLDLNIDWQSRAL